MFKKGRKVMLIEEFQKTTKVYKNQTGIQEMEKYNM